jgi:hypothetical protein
MRAAEQARAEVVHEIDRQTAAMITCEVRTMRGVLVLARALEWRQAMDHEALPTADGPATNSRWRRETLGVALAAAVMSIGGET